VKAAKGRVGETLPVTLDDVRDAARRISGRVHRTPLLRSRSIEGMLGRTVVFKTENLQRAGSFKIRGATNRIALAQARSEPPRGVVTYSSGNHGQAVALAAREAGLAAAVVVPEDVSRAKLEAVAAYGAEIHTRGLTSEERKERAEQLAAERGWEIVPPFDDAGVVAGQGTAGLEIAEDVEDLGAVVVPVGGGGLLAGVAVAVKALRPEALVVGVEPDTADGMRRSLEAGRIVPISPSSTVADGLRPLAPGRIPFEVARALVDRVVTVSDEEIVEALWVLLERTKLLAEPSGVAGFAAVRAGRVPPTPGRVAVVLSGGNVARPLLARLLGARGAGGVVE
jgi:threonine dehydratase